MAPKKDTKKDDKKKDAPKPIPAELKALIEKEKAIPKVDKPDRAELDALNEKTQADIAKIEEKLEGVNKEIAAKTTGKEDFYKAKDEIKAKLDEYAGKIDALKKKREDLFGGIKSKKSEDRAKRDELSSLKKKLGFESIDDVADAIRKIEYEMQHKSLTLTEEKNYMKKISELKKMAPQVKKVTGMTVQTDESAITGMKGDIDELKKEMDNLFEAKKIQSEALKKIQEARKAVMDGVPHLFEAREKLNAEKREKIQARNAKRDEFNAKNKEFNDYLWEVKKIRNDRGKIERDMRQAEWEERNKADKEAEGPPPAPFQNELILLANTLTYLNSFIAVKEEEKKENVAPAEAAGILLPKDAREQVYEFAPLKPSKKGKKSAKSSAPKAAPIKHSFESLEIFDKFKVSPPANATAVPAAIEQLEKRVGEYKAKQEKAAKEAERKAKLTPEEKAAEEAPKEEEAVAA